MPLIADAVLDLALATLDTNGTKIDITVGEATTYTEATGLYNGTTQLSCGDAVVNTGAPEAGTTDGRKVVVPAITAGDVTATQTVTHWALTNGTTTLYAAGPLTASQAVTINNTFTLDAIDITIRDATAV